MDDPVTLLIEYLESGGLEELPEQLSLFQSAYRSVRIDRALHGKTDPKTCPTARMLVRRFLPDLTQHRESTCS